MDRKTADELQQHIRSTYFGLRIGLAAIGIALPFVVLIAGGVLHGVWLEPSISQYYHTTGSLSYFTTRDFFVGGLFAAAACLYLYKGFSTKENVALNLAGVFAVFVALLPTAATSKDDGIVSKLHVTSAILFFLCIAYVSIFRSRDTLDLLPQAKQRWYARAYFWTGVALIVSPVAAALLSLIVNPTSLSDKFIFFLEACAVWAFAAYWIIKTREMRQTNAESRGLSAELERVVLPAPAPQTDPSSAGGQPNVILRKLSPKFAQIEKVVPADEAHPI